MHSYRKKAVILLLCLSTLFFSGCRFYMPWNQAFLNVGLDDKGLLQAEVLYLADETTPSTQYQVVETLENEAESPEEEEIVEVEIVVEEEEESPEEEQKRVRTVRTRDEESDVEPETEEIELDEVIPEPEPAEKKELTKTSEPEIVQAKPQPTPAPKVEPQPKLEPKPEPAPEPKPEPKPEPEPVVVPEIPGGSFTVMAEPIEIPKLNLYPGKKESYLIANYTVTAKNDEFDLEELKFNLAGLKEIDELEDLELYHQVLVEGREYVEEEESGLLLDGDFVPPEATKIATESLAKDVNDRVYVRFQDLDIHFLDGAKHSFQLKGRIKDYSVSFRSNLEPSGIKIMSKLADAELDKSKISFQDKAGKVLVAIQGAQHSFIKTMPLIKKLAPSDNYFGGTKFAEILHFELSAPESGGYKIKKLSFNVSSPSVNLGNFQLRASNQIIADARAQRNSGNLSTTVNSNPLELKVIDVEKYLPGQVLRINEKSNTDAMGNQIALVTAVDYEKSKITVDPAGNWDRGSGFDVEYSLQPFIGEERNGSSAIRSGTITFLFRDPLIIKAGETRNILLLAETDEEGTGAGGAVASILLDENAETVHPLFQWSEDLEADAYKNGYGLVLGSG